MERRDLTYVHEVPTGIVHPELDQDGGNTVGGVVQRLAFVEISIGLHERVYVGDGDAGAVPLLDDKAPLNRASQKKPTVIYGGRGRH